MVVGGGGGDDRKEGPTGKKSRCGHTLFLSLVIKVRVSPATN